MVETYRLEGEGSLVNSQLQKKCNIEIKQKGGGKNMKMFDIHSHLSTKEGYLLQDPEDIEALEKYYKAKIVFKTEDEMYQDFKKADVKIILAPAFKTKGATLDWLKESHSYIARVMKEHPDVYCGAWVWCDPQHGREGVAELERCIKDLGMTGPCFFGGISKLPYSDKSHYPFL